jgi:hypothetical protein
MVSRKIKQYLQDLQERDRQNMYMTRQEEEKIYI